MVQPGVAALGYHHSSTYRPAKSSSFTASPSWLDKLNEGAALPASINDIRLPSMGQWSIRWCQSSMKRGKKKNLFARKSTLATNFLVIPRIPRILEA